MRNSKGKGNGQSDKFKEKRKWEIVMKYWYWNRGEKIKSKSPFLKGALTVLPAINKCH